MAACLVVAAVVVTARLLTPLPVAGAEAAVPHTELSPVAGLPAVKVPTTPVGLQLKWLLGVGPRLPLSTKEVSATLMPRSSDSEPGELNQALESLGPPGSTATLLGLSRVEATSLVALVRIGASRTPWSSAVDSAGLIAGLARRRSMLPPMCAPKSWAQVDEQLTTIAPEVSLLAAKVGSDGTLQPRSLVLAGTPGPSGRCSNCSSWERSPTRCTTTGSAGPKR